MGRWASGHVHTWVSASCVARASAPLPRGRHQNFPIQGLNPEAQPSMPNVERGERSGSGVVFRCPSPAPALPPQLVAGIKYYLTLEMGSTACRKNVATGDGVDVTTCPLATGVQEEVTAPHPTAQHPRPSIVRPELVWLARLMSG